MAGTRTLAALLDHAERQRVKVVLVGDPLQLPEIDAGGLFALLAARLDPIELTANRRQTRAWEVAALDELRHGDPTSAIDAYAQHGRVAAGESAEAVREELVADWWQAFHRAGATSAVMVALRQADVADINARARDRLDAAGELTGPRLEADGAEYRAGDRVVCLRNDRRLGVTNGTFAIIEAVDPDARSLLVRRDDGVRLRIPRRYLDAGHVTHGYAITGHKAQGLTVDHSFVLGSPELYREWGYVALSRGRETNRLYVHAAAADQDDAMHGRQPEPDPLAQVISALHRSRSQTSASEMDDGAVAQVAGWRDLRLRLAAVGPERRKELERQHRELTAERRHLAVAIEREQEQRSQAARRLGRLTRRDELARLDGELARRRLTLQRLDEQLQQASDKLAALPKGTDLQPLEAAFAASSAAVLQLSRLRADAAVHRPSDYVLRTLGRRPDNPDARARWHTAVQAIEEYRLCWGVTDAVRPLGDTADNPVMQAYRQQAMRALLEAFPGQERPLERDRTFSRGLSL